MKFLFKIINDSVMSDLASKKCIPCEGGVKAFDISEIHKYTKKVDGWDIIQIDKKLSSRKKIWI